jgi:acetoin utilization protein AcuB
MLTVELINQNIPRLHLQDTVSKSLQLINDYKLTHLPVVADDKLLGLLSEEDLLDAEDGKMTVEMLQDNFINAFAPDNVHFLTAVNVATQFETSVVPVVSEDRELLGVITTSDLLKAMGNFAGANEIGGIIMLEMERSQFSISEISRLVESNDASILHLNTTVHAETGLLTVTLHLNKKEIAAIIATFERYDYEVIYFFGDENMENEIHSNYRHLMNYLDI